MDYRTFSKVNIGCGYDKLPGYLNVDVHPDTGADILIKDNDLSVLPQRHFEEVLAHNVLEHIPHEFTVSALLDWTKLLKLNGTLDVETSDVLGIFEQMRKQVSFEHEFNWMKCMFGNQKHPGDIHYYGFTPRTLRTFLSVAGLSFGEFQFRDIWIIRCRAVKIRDWTYPANFIGSDADFVTYAYREILKREPEDYTVSHLSETLAGGRAREDVVRQLTISDENLYKTGLRLS